MITPAMTASMLTAWIPCVRTYEAIMPDNAPVGPIILKLLPAKSEATNPAHNAVIMPCTGDTREATAKEIDRGIEINAMVHPDFKLDLIFLIIRLTRSVRLSMLCL